MKKGDKVKMSPMWKYEKAIGEIIKITSDGYTVVKWDNINGEWHYTKEQSKKLENLSVIKKTEDEETMWKTWGDR